ncbi:MAG TPA: acyl carrier protein [Planctomycetaceae bacterium]|nr:acyl carrier protein [Planctomycetaceae bacterium]
MTPNHGANLQDNLTREQVLDGIRRIIAEQSETPIEQIDEDAHLVNGLGCDSLDVIEIAMEIEEQFDIDVPDDTAEKAETVGKIVDRVFERVAPSSV